MNQPDATKASPPNPDTIDELYTETLLLKLIIYGMLHIIREYDSDFYHQVSSAASIQLLRFENVVKKLS